MELRKKFSRNIEQVEHDLNKMSDMTISALRMAVESVNSSNFKLAKKIIADDKLINQKQVEIEDLCITLLATQQPVAQELRELVSVLSIVNELERMADHAATIAKFSLELEDLSKEVTEQILPHITAMSEKVIKMIRKSIEAFLGEDEQLARIIWISDKAVDTYFQLIYSEVFKTMVKNPKLIKQTSKFLWEAHYIERIGDRAANICERTFYLVSGNLDSTDIL